MPDLVSVIVPFFSKCYFDLDIPIKSVLEQSYKDIEIIIIDDRSPVSAVKCINRYKNDERVKILKNTSNLGGGISRNVGIKESKGKYIAFLDHDDKWYPDKIMKQLMFFKSLNVENQDENVVVYSKCRVIDDEIDYIVPKRGILKNEKVSDYIFHSLGLIQTSGIFLEKSLALKAPFHDLKRHQDYQLCFSLEEIGSHFYILDEPLYDFIQIPKKNDYVFSQKWFELYERYFTKRSKVGFKKIIMLRSFIAHQDYIKGFKYAVNNKVFYAYLKYNASFLIKKYLPKRIIHFLQTTIRKRR
ncbi:glycosyltransferase family 2 protein [Pseudoalteromonas sp. NZS37]|uniref:glycosyltransferase family 2 protein n=1 Tax=Pseudoalteromonas sp. NZS37 TaxID=2792071 RepID=UPI0018CE5A8A|nr:glycosyltransferase family 2 protein [Pseudoalteromonas sp. NZS37]MBG9989997.1 glycosyltransferase family 2 protein [Pseudoalteromonas sp. NZS37]